MPPLIGQRGSLKRESGATDRWVVSRERTLERIEAAFADAAARGDFSEAEGWLAVARLAQARVRETSPERPGARPTA
jgi:hypothetical protein